MSSKKKKIYTYLGKVILITLLIVFCVRTFFVESYTMSSSQMESTLMEGDRIFIDKTAYGIRLPVTLLTVPFTFDNLFGLKSYSSLIQIPYSRIGESMIERNDIVMFNNPMETDKPLDKGSLILSRCVGLPGDTLEMKQGYIFIDGLEYIGSPDRMDEYVIKTEDGREVKNILEDENIPLRDFVFRNDSVFLYLTKLEAFILGEYLNDSIEVNPVLDSVTDFKFLIPYKGKIIDINDRNLLVYKQIIQLEEKEANVNIEDKRLTINGKAITEYTFKDDYYWMLSDNTLNAVDSRSLGFIPFKNVIGKATYIWYSSDEEKPRWNRCFNRIN